MAEYIVTRRYTEEEFDLYTEHKNAHLDLSTYWEEGRIIYDATPYGDDYIEGYGFAKARFQYEEDARRLAEKIGGKVRRVR